MARLASQLSDAGVPGEFGEGDEGEAGQTGDAGVGDGDDRGVNGLAASDAGRSHCVNRSA